MEQNLSQYHIFYVTARCGNISKASRELFISQPAVSKAIQKLEQTLNTVLFRRGSRGVTLTEDGELLYRHVREAFTSLEAAEQSLERKHALGISHLRIGASTTLCKYVLLPYLQRFIQLHPHVILFLMKLLFLYTRFLLFVMLLLAKLCIFHKPRYRSIHKEQKTHCYKHYGKYI